MNFKRIFRVLVCLVLICALLTNISPIKARAVVTPYFQMMPEEIVIRSVAGGIGAAMKDDPDAFSGLCDFIRNVWDAAGYIVDGMVKVFRLPSSLGDGELNYIEKALVELTRDSLIDAGWIRLGLEFSTSHSFSSGTSDYVVESASPFALIVITEPRSGSMYTAHYLAVAPYSFSISINGNYSQDAKDYGYYYARSVLSSSKYLPMPKFTMPHYEVSSVGNNYGGILAEELPGVSFLVGGLTSAFVGDPRLDFASAYPGWTSIEALVDGVPLQLVGLGVGQTLEETNSMTQEQIWAGEILGELEELQQQQVTQSFLQELFHQPLQTLGNILETLIELPGRILSGLTEILTNVLQLLFVPRQEFLQEKIQLLTQRFAFVTSLVDTGKAISTGLSGISTSPPVIYIDLGANRGPHNLGGRVPFLDLRWYAEYKPTVDTIISAFLWICFIWRMLLKLPGIISGMPGDWVMGSAHSFGLDNHLPSRNSAYEVQRQSNREQIRRGPGK